MKMTLTATASAGLWRLSDIGTSNAKQSTAAMASVNRRDKGTNISVPQVKLFAEQQVAKAHQLGVVCKPELDAAAAGGVHEGDRRREFFAQARLEVALFG